MRDTTQVPWHATRHAIAYIRVAETLAVTERRVTAFDSFRASSPTTATSPRLAAVCSLTGAPDRLPSHNNLRGAEVLPTTRRDRKATVCWSPCTHRLSIQQSGIDAGLPCGVGTLRR